jgi:hypothetical protein
MDNFFTHLEINTLGMTREPASFNEKVLEEAKGDAEGLPLLQVHTIQVVFSTTHEAKYTSSP